MNTIERNMRLLNRRPNEKLIYLYLYYQNIINNINDNNNKHTIMDIAKKLSMDRSNVWNYIKELEKKGLIEVICIDKKLEVIV